LVVIPALPGGLLEFYGSRKMKKPPLPWTVEVMRKRLREPQDSSANDNVNASPLHVNPKSRGRPSVEKQLTQQTKLVN